MSVCTVLYSNYAANASTSIDFLRSQLYSCNNEMRQAGGWEHHPATDYSAFETCTRKKRWKTGWTLNVTCASYASVSNWNGEYCPVTLHSLYHPGTYILRYLAVLYLNLVFYIDTCLSLLNLEVVLDQSGMGWTHNMRFSLLTHNIGLKE